MNGISGISGLTGGNCSLEEHRAYQRMEEEMMSEREAIRELSQIVHELCRSLANSNRMGYMPIDTTLIAALAQDADKLTFRIMNESNTASQEIPQ